jgi:hypothetical protein
MTVLLEAAPSVEIFDIEVLYLLAFLLLKTVYTIIYASY